MHVLFANTGVQIVCVPIQAGRRFTTAQIGYGWQYGRCLGKKKDEEDEEEAPPVVDFPYIQWQIIQSAASKLFLAIDTSLGDPDVGYFCDPTSLHGDFPITLENLLDRTGQPLQGIPRVEVVLRAATATAGEAKPVHMVIDFGNSRTGALLLEMSGEVAQSAKMMPFELMNRYMLDSFSESGEQISRPSARWFSSKTRWCNSPYLSPQERVKKEYYRETVKGLFGSKQVTRDRETFVTPNLFDDLSMARLGAEADDVSQVMHAKGEFRIGVSSPKRYLWADDDSWLEGAFWYMADPHDRCNTSVFGSKLQGRLLRFIHEDDRDFLLGPKEPTEEAYASEVPIKPRHAPRSMMVIAIYELLSQAYMYINSLAYRTATGDAARSREIRSFSLTFPSGMFQPERERLAAQVQKAVNIFSRSIGKFQKFKPTVKLSIDEASAVHLTYIWSELQMLGQDPRLWFAALGSRKRPMKSAEEGAEGADGTAATVGALPAGRRRGTAPRPRMRPGGGAAMNQPEEEEDAGRQELRIACIDIGGGTTDLMIAKYTFEPGIDDSIHGQVLHQDGLSVAGDQLVKRMLEKIVVPWFVQTLGFEEEDVQLLFGPEVPKNRGFVSQRIDWVNRLFVPLAEVYLQCAVAGDEEREISHDDPEVVDPAVVESLEQVCNRLRGPGYYNLQQPLGLKYERERFEAVVYEVFDELLFDFCRRIVKYQTDVVLLAGQPTKLEFIQRMIRMYVPLPASRIVPMFNHYAGNWYPYQDAKGHAPGLIVDPKSAVVVGAAVEFLARNGMLPQFRFSMQGKETENTYHWGVMTESTSTIRDERILFHAAKEDIKDEWTEFNTIAQRVMIGRKMVPEEEAQANPIYVIKMDTGNRIGETNVTIRIRRNRATAEKEEHLEIESVDGSVAGEPAELGRNVIFKWRTLADERFYLDTGGLDNIEVAGNR